MSTFQPQRGFLAAAGVTLAFAVVSLTAHKGAGLTAFADLFGLFVMLAAVGVCVANARRHPAQRRFWGLMALGCLLWATNQTAWTIWENILHRPIPDPFVFDI